MVGPIARSLFANREPSPVIDKVSSAGPDELLNDNKYETYSVQGAPDMNLRRISLSLAMAFALATPMAVAQLNATPTNMVGYDMATVRYGQLARLHKSSSQLRALDVQIAMLEEKRTQVRLEARQRLDEEADATIRKAVKQARTELAEHRATSDAQLNALRARLFKQVEAEMRALQSELESELIHSSTAPISQAQLEDFQQNLFLVRNRNAAAKRLELEKEMNRVLSARKSLDQKELAAYEAELAARYRDEQVNLHLRIQNSPDQSVREQASQRLAEIAEKLKTLKRARRERSQSRFAALQAEQSRVLQAELLAFQAKSEQQFIAKVEAKKKELNPGIQAKTDEIKSRLDEELEKKQEAVSVLLRDEADKARIRYEAQEKKATARLQELKARVATEVANLPPEVKDEIQELAARIEKFQAERGSLREAIRESVSDKVGEVARRLDHQMVIGISELEYSSLPDLTDRSLAGVASLPDIR